LFPVDNKHTNTNIIKTITTSQQQQKKRDRMIWTERKKEEMGMIAYVCSGVRVGTTATTSNQKGEQKQKAITIRDLFSFFLSLSFSNRWVGMGTCRSLFGYLSAIFIAQQFTAQLCRHRFFGFRSTILGVPSFNSCRSDFSFFFLL